MTREGLLVGTRPQIADGRIILTGAEGFDGYEIMEYKGMVWGISVRAKDMGQDCAMGCKHMVGGELKWNEIIPSFSLISYVIATEPSLIFQPATTGRSDDSSRQGNVKRST